MVLETINRHDLFLRGFGSNPGKEESKVRISAIKAIVPACDAASSNEPDGSVNDEPTSGSDSGRMKWRRESKVVDITGFDGDTQLGFLFDYCHHHRHNHQEENININGKKESEVVVARFEVEMVVVEHERSEGRGGSGSMSLWSPGATCQV